MLEQLASYGLPIVLLYADPALESITAARTEDAGIYTMTVPVPDSYIYLASKLELAYKYLYQLGVSGIIKFDDDVTICDWSCIRELLHSVIPSCDYFGVAYSTYPAGVHPVNPKHLRLHSLKLVWHLPIDLTFFLGGFYYISQKAIKDIIDHGLGFPQEDVSVAFALEKNPEIRKLFSAWHQLGRITWEAQTDMTS
jgi:hypothetical protein